MRFLELKFAKFLQALLVVPLFYLFLIISLLASSGVPAFAEGTSCAAKLQPTFTGAQAIKLCSTFGSAIAQSLIPSADNTYDLGSATKTWRTLYTGTSRIAKTSDILRVRQDPQRLFSWDASSDTVLVQNFGDGGVTAAQNFFLAASTTAGDDDAVIQICPSGSCTVQDGARIILYGAENALNSSLFAQSGDDAGADVFISSADDITLEDIGGTDIIRFDAPTAAITKYGATDFNFDVGLATIALQEAVAGTACSGTLTANGATPVVTSTTCATTGSRIFLQRTSAETGTVNAWVSALSNGVSFSITSEAADTGTYNWVIFHEAP